MSRWEHAPEIIDLAGQLGVGVVRPWTVSSTIADAGSTPGAGP